MIEVGRQPLAIADAIQALAERLDLSRQQAWA
jgi:hypothetical protein